MARALMAFAITLVGSMADPAASQSAPAEKEFNARVSVVVSSSDDTGALVKSFLTRELRELPDVTVTDLDPDWTMSVIAMETRNQAGGATGYAVGYSLLRALDTDRFKPLRSTEQGVPADEQADVSEMRMTMLVTMASLAVFQMDQQLLVGPMDSLKRTCESIVANFDAQHLEGERRTWQRIRDLQNRQN